MTTSRNKLIWQAFSQTEKGISIVEIMVGLAVGMLAVTVMLNLFATTAQRNNVTTSTADAQINGQIALVSIERDARNAGLGLSTMTCDNGITIHNENYSPTTFNLSGLPIEITGNGSDQTVTITTSTDSLGAFTTTINKWNLASAEIDVANTVGFEIAYDNSSSTNRPLALIKQSGKCAVIQLTQVQPSAKKVQHNPGNEAPFNPKQAKTFFEGLGYSDSAGGNVSLFGAIEAYRYQLNGDTLEAVNLTPAGGGVSTTDQLVSGVVALRAQYGIDRNKDGVIDSFIAHNDSSFATNPLKSDEVLAIRVALVVRADQRDGSYTAIDPTWWEGGSNNTYTVPSDQKNFRYRVFESVIPLRNPIWNR